MNNIKALPVLLFFFFSCRHNDFEHGPINCNCADIQIGTYYGVDSIFQQTTQVDTVFQDTCTITNVSDPYTCKVFISYTDSFHLVSPTGDVIAHDPAFQIFIFSGDSIYIKNYFDTYPYELKTKFTGKR